MKKNEKFFNKTHSKMSLQDKLNYINKHFYYFTMNSWNRTKTLANNVKIYNLPLTTEQKNKFYEIAEDENLSQELYNNINYLLYDFEAQNPGLEVYFNGRSGGYIVIKNKGNNENIIDENITDSANKQDLINYFKNVCGWSFKDSQAEAKRIIEENFETCILFDNLCDEILQEFKHILNNSQIEEEEILYTKKIKSLIF